MQEIFEKIDRLFDENKPKEAEQYMLDECRRAQTEGRSGDELMLLNELIGYYRQTSEKDKLIDCVTNSIAVAKQMGIEGTIPYATTLLNGANAYRSIGKLDISKELYSECEQIYSSKIDSGELSEDDLLISGLYNNISLLYQETKEYKTAEEYQLRALQIVNKNNAGFEIAVTHANLANTYLGEKDYGKAEIYAKKAISLFKERNFFDPHYCAALSALAYCCLENGDSQQAKKCFVEALNIVETTFGKNSQYERLKESIALCEKMDTNASEIKTSGISGLELSRAYYEKYGRTMIEEKFPSYADKIAVGLVGEGSECYGFDDHYSTDHDFGPDFCMWISSKTYSEIGKQLIKEYNRLPSEFMGWTKTSTVMGADRRGVFIIDEFYKKYLGTSEYDEIDFKSLPDYCLAVCTNGEVFRDDEGIFSSIRDKIKAGYPADVRLLKLSEDVARYSQCGQYNYLRMKNRNDELSAQLMISDFCKHTMKMYHHYMNAFPPHDKWLAQSTKRLDGGEYIINWLNNILSFANMGKSEEAVNEIDVMSDYIAFSLYKNGDISDTDNYLDHHVAELMFKSNAATNNKEELVEKIVRLEFEAFDKVNNEGGRASCQNDWPTFSVMRKSQYLTWNMAMLMQYYYDFNREYESGHNLITEKYGRMMESTAPERYAEIKDNFPELSDEKKSVIEQIVGIQMQMVEAFAKDYPKVTGNARNLHTAEDNMFDTSYETYLRGEISTYSDKMLQLYGQFVVKKAMDGENIAHLTIENTAKLYGFKNLEDFEKRAQ